MQTGVLFGGLVAVGAAIEALRADAAFTEAIPASSVIGSTGAPEGVTGPFVLVWAEKGVYGEPPMGGDLHLEQCRVVVSCRVAGADLGPIQAAAVRQFELLNGRILEYQDDYGDYGIGFQAESEVLPNNAPDQGRFFTQLGIAYSVTVEKG